MMPSWRGAASHPKSLWVASKIKSRRRRRRRWRRRTEVHWCLLLSGLVSCLLFFSDSRFFSLCVCVFFFFTSSQSLSPQEVHAVCWRRVVLSRSSAVLLLPPAFPHTTPPLVGQLSAAGDTGKKIELCSCTLAKAIRNGQKLTEAARGGVCVCGKKLKG